MFKKVQFVRKKAKFYLSNIPVKRCFLGKRMKNIVFGIKKLLQNGKFCNSDFVLGKPDQSFLPPKIRSM